MRKFITSIILATFIGSSIQAPVYGSTQLTTGAQMAQLPWMPKPGVRLGLSPEFSPAYLKGIVVHPEDPFKFDFIIYKGDKPLSDAQKRQEYTKLTKYFLASLAIPDDDQWVNLSPYEKDRIIKDDFGKTLMGRDLLAQDYILKQITASLIYPEDNLGKNFWNKVYAKAQQQYGTTNIPVNTFNKVWILPDDALIYEKGNTAYVLKNHLKVMLEEDYLSLQKHSGVTANTHALGSQAIRELILPALEKEVNEGKNFAPLRQVYSGMLLAAWFKRTLRKSILGQIYADKTKVKGVDQPACRQAGTLCIDNEAIYQRYLRAYKKGVFNYIKEESFPPLDGEGKGGVIIPRKYFSGGEVGYNDPKDGVKYSQVVHTISRIDFAQTHQLQAELPNIDLAQASMNRTIAQAPRDAAMTAKLPRRSIIKTILWTSAGTGVASLVGWKLFFHSSLSPANSLDELQSLLSSPDTNINRENLMAINATLTLLGRIIDERHFQKLMDLRKEDRIIIRKVSNEKMNRIYELAQEMGAVEKGLTAEYAFTMRAEFKDKPPLYIVIIDENQFGDPTSLFTTLAHEWFGHIVSEEMDGPVQGAGSEVKAYTVELAVLKVIIENLSALRDDIKNYKDPEGVEWLRLVLDSEKLKNMQRQDIITLERYKHANNQAMTGGQAEKKDAAMTRRSFFQTLSTAGVGLMLHPSAQGQQGVGGQLDHDFDEIIAATSEKIKFTGPTDPKILEDLPTSGALHPARQVLDVIKDYQYQFFSSFFTVDEIERDKFHPKGSIPANVVEIIPSLRKKTMQKLVNIMGPEWKPSAGMDFDLFMVKIVTKFLGQYNIALIWRRFNPLHLTSQDGYRFDQPLLMFYHAFMIDRVVPIPIKEPEAWAGRSVNTDRIIPGKEIGPLNPLNFSSQNLALGIWGDIYYHYKEFLDSIRNSQKSLLMEDGRTNAMEEDEFFRLIKSRGLEKFAFLYAAVKARAYKISQTFEDLTNDEMEAIDAHEGNHLINREKLKNFPVDSEIRAYLASIRKNYVGWLGVLLTANRTNIDLNEPNQNAVNYIVEKAVTYIQSQPEKFPMFHDTNDQNAIKMQLYKIGIPDKQDPKKDKQSRTLREHLADVIYWQHKMEFEQKTGIKLEDIPEVKDIDANEGKPDPWRLAEELIGGGIVVGTATALGIKWWTKRVEAVKKTETPIAKIPQGKSKVNKSKARRERKKGSEAMTGKDAAMTRRFFLTITAAGALKMITPIALAGAAKIIPLSDFENAFKLGKLGEVQKMVDDLIKQGNNIVKSIGVDKFNEYLSAINNIARKYGYLVFINEKMGVVLKIINPTLQNRKILDVKVVSKSEDLTWPDFMITMDFDDKQSGWYVPTSDDGGQVWLIPMSQEIINVFPQAIETVMNNPIIEDKSDIQRPIDDLTGRYVKLAVGNQSGRMEKLLGTHLISIKPGTLNKLLPLYYAAHRVNLSLRNKGYFITDDFQFMKINSTKDGVLFLHQPNDSETPFLGLTSMGGQSMVDEDMADNLSGIVKDDLYVKSLKNTYLNRWFPIIKNFFKFAFDGMSDQQITDKILDIISKHEITHRRLWQSVARKILGSEVDPDTLNFDQFSRIALEIDKIHDQNEVIARFSEINTSIKEGRLNDVWASLFIASLAGNGLVNIGFIFAILSGNAKAQQILAQIQAELKKDQPSTERLAQLLRPDFNILDVTNDWNNIVREHSNGNSQTQIIAERGAKAYQLFLDAWGVIKGVKIDNAMNSDAAMGIKVTEEKNYAWYGSGNKESFTDLIADLVANHGFTYAFEGNELYPTVSKAFPSGSVVIVDYDYGVTTYVLRGDNVDYISELGWGLWDAVIHHPTTTNLSIEGDTSIKTLQNPTKIKDDVLHLVRDKLGDLLNFDTKNIDGNPMVLLFFKNRELSLSLDKPKGKKYYELSMNFSKSTNKNENDMMEEIFLLVRDFLNSSDAAMAIDVGRAQQTFNRGGIDLNSANLSMVIKRDGKGVVLPLAQQDLAQLGNIEGLDPVILSIKPAGQTPLFSQLQSSP